MGTAAQHSPVLFFLQTSVRQVSQMRFYVTERRAMTPHVSLFVGGLPPGLSPQDYGNLLHEAMATKGVTLGYPGLWLGEGPDWAMGLWWQAYVLLPPHAPPGPTSSVSTQDHPT